MEEVAPIHQPVLLAEVCALLPHRGVIVDGTLGFAGHAAALLTLAEQEGEQLRLIGIDQDTDALAAARERLRPWPEVSLVHANFSSMEEVVRAESIGGVDGVLLDIGVSSYQLDTPERGFSFISDGPLDMRMDQDEPRTAAEIVNRCSEREIADLIYRYGEERLSRRIARGIVERRRSQPFTRTTELAEAIAQWVPRQGRIHPATRTFQALRIAVNGELEVLEEGIAQSLRILKPKGVMCIISFHSLEDRIVKHRFRAASETGEYTLLTRKPVVASQTEARENPRSRSAKLRAITRV